MSQTSSDSGILFLISPVTPCAGVANRTQSNITARIEQPWALTVFAELRQQKPVLEDLRNTTNQPLLGVSGYGERRPLPDATSLAESDLKRNRRIDLRFVLSSRTSDELKGLLDRIFDLQKADTR